MSQIEVAKLVGTLGLDVGNLDRDIAAARSAMEQLRKKSDELFEAFNRGKLNAQEYQAAIMAVQRAERDLAATTDVLIQKQAAAFASSGQIMVGMSGVAATSNQLGMRLMQLSFISDDLQYGFTAIVNNLPMLVAAFGGGPGLAGAIGIAGVAVNQLIKHWSELVDLLGMAGGKQGIDPAIVRLEDLKQKVKELREELEKKPSPNILAELGQAEDVERRRGANVGGFRAMVGRHEELPADEKKRVGDVIAEIGGDPRALHAAVAKQLEGEPQTVMDPAERNRFAAMQARLRDREGRGDFATPEEAAANETAIAKIRDALDKMADAVAARIPEKAEEIVGEATRTEAGRAELARRAGKFDPALAAGLNGEIETEAEAAATIKDREKAVKARHDAEMKALDEEERIFQEGIDERHRIGEANRAFAKKKAKAEQDLEKLQEDEVLDAAKAARKGLAEKIAEEAARPKASWMGIDERLKSIQLGALNRPDPAKEQLKKLDEQIDKMEEVRKAIAKQGKLDRILAVIDGPAR